MHRKNEPEYYNGDHYQSPPLKGSSGGQARLSQNYMPQNNNMMQDPHNNQRGRPRNQNQNQMHMHNNMHMQNMGPGGQNQNSNKLKNENIITAV